MLIRGAMRTQKLLFFDDANPPLNGQLPVTAFARRNNRVAGLQHAFVAT